MINSAKWYQSRCEIQAAVCIFSFLFEVKKQQNEEDMAEYINRYVVTWSN